VLYLTFTPEFPVRVVEYHYYTMIDFVSEIGGTLKFLQIFIALFSARFLYKEYTQFMARHLIQNEKKEASHEELKEI
jgi:hypothetical protein